MRIISDFSYKQTVAESVIIMIFHLTFLLLVVYACGANVPDVPVVDVHCSVCEILSCCIFEPLNIHEPTVLKFVDADKWRDLEHVIIASTTNITVFPSGIFQQFPQLRSLNISAELKSIAKDDFKNADQLTTLSINSHQLQVLPANVFEYAKQLFVIIFVQNQLTTIEDYAFNGLNKLKYIYLGNNSLTELKRNTFAGAPNIELIRLEHNRIESIEDGVFDLPKLEFVVLSNNRIQSFPDHLFRSAPKLYFFEMHENGLKHIGKAFHDCKELLVLDLNNNHIDDIDLVALAELPKLGDLKINNSGFQWGDGDQWPDTTSILKWMDVSSNGLTGSDALTRLRHFSNLETLNLSDNNFSGLDGFEDIKTNFPKLKKIGLSGNKFNCDRLKSIVDGLQTQYVTAVQTVEIDGDVKNYKGVTCL